MSEIRLQKYMADSGVASRRKCEELIQSGRVHVNGRLANTLGLKVHETDRVTVDGRPVRPLQQKTYILLNKPAGYITSAHDQFDRPTVMDLIKDEIHTRVYPVGRLDYDTEGLLIMTNDGGVTYALTHPKHVVFKTYRATLNTVPLPKAIERLKKGIVLDGRKTAPAKLNWLKDNLIEISISEGRNRQVRRMFEAVGYEVVRLQRIAEGKILLGNVPPGRWRHLTKAEIRYLKELQK